MAAGATDRLWNMDEVAELVDAAAPKAGKRGPYKARQPVEISGGDATRQFVRQMHENRARWHEDFFQSASHQAFRPLGDIG